VSVYWRRRPASIHPSFVSISPVRHNPAPKLRRAPTLSQNETSVGLWETAKGLAHTAQIGGKTTPLSSAFFKKKHSWKPSHSRKYRPVTNTKRSARNELARVAVLWFGPPQGTGRGRRRRRSLPVLRGGAGDCVRRLELGRIRQNVNHAEI
jgi:hypothetical protein